MGKVCEKLNPGVNFLAFLDYKVCGLKLHACIKSSGLGLLFYMTFVDGFQ